MAHTFNSRTQRRERQAELYELEASLVYIASFKPVMAIHRDHLNNKIVL